MPAPQSDSRSDSRSESSLESSTEPSSEGQRSRIRLVVLFGGRSAEHDVSCVSARHVVAAADPDRYDVQPVGITRDGEWVLAEDALAALEHSRKAGTDKLPASLAASGPAVDAMPLLAKTANAVAPHDAAAAEVTATGAAAAAEVTVVMPVLHGPMGEDGTIQGMLELTGVPYVGAGVLASALCMDKVAAKSHLAAHDIPQCRYRWLTVDQGSATQPDGQPTTIEAEVEAAIAELGLPLFVKPANMGSSVGVSRATTHDEVTAAIELASTYDRIVLIEEELRGREIEIAVLGNENPEASVAGEIVPGADFYDYADKYDDGADLRIPADLAPEELAAAQQLAVAAFRALRVEGLARVDFFYEDSGSGSGSGSVSGSEGRGWLVNEVNTMPGFTPISMYPKLWDASGLAYSDLIDRLVDLAIARHDRTQRHARTDH